MNRNEFEELKSILLEHGIDRLFHITDRSNWTSIKENNGIRSSDSLRNCDAVFKGSCGDGLSRHIDQELSLSDYIHLSFIPEAPWQRAAEKAGFIKEPIILEVPLDILLDEDTQFSTGSPSSSISKIGGAKEVFKSIDFDTLVSDPQEISEPDKRDAFQAEALVKRFIPFDRILNHKDIENQLSETKLEGSFKRSAIIFLIDQSVSMGRSIILNGQLEGSISFAVTEMVDKFIQQIATAGASDPTKLNPFDIAVIGYGEDCSSIWAQGAPFGEFASVEQLSDHYMRNGFLEPGPFHWINSQNDSFSADMSKAFKYVMDMVRRWIDSNGSNCIPPCIIHITDAEKLGMQSKGSVQIARQIMHMENRNGAAKIWNIQMNPHDSHPVTMPTDEETGGLNAHGYFLFQMSSGLSNSDCRLVKDSLPEWEDVEEGLERKALIVNPADLSPIYRILTT